MVPDWAHHAERDLREDHQPGKQSTSQAWVDGDPGKAFAFEHAGGGQASADHRSFHRCRPAGGDPITGQVKPGQGSAGSRTQTLDLGREREDRLGIGHDPAAQKLCRSRRGQRHAAVHRSPA